MRGISQTQLADLCNSSTGYIGEIESGKRFPSVKMIERLASALAVESWYLFKNEPVNLSNLSHPKLAPSQKKEFMKMANSAIAKILDDF